jgi:hypothetical protein
VYLYLIFCVSKHTSYTWLGRTACNSSTQESERKDRVQAQHELYRRPCLKTQRNNKKRANHTEMFQKCFLMWIIFKFRIKRNRCVKNWVCIESHYGARSTRSECSKMSIASFWAGERVNRETYAPHPSHHPLQEEFCTMGSPDIFGVGFHLL